MTLEQRWTKSARSAPRTPAELGLMDRWPSRASPGREAPHGKPLLPLFPIGPRIVPRGIDLRGESTERTAFAGRPIGGRDTGRAGVNSHADRREPFTRACW